MNKNFNHTQFAHCESGVISSLLTHNGLKISEPMVFGITSSINFAYLPIFKINSMPLIAYRAIPKNIIRNIQKNLGIKMFTKTYSNFLNANDDLKHLIKIEKKLIGLQTSVFYLPYIPENMRFHFNAHNLLVYGHENNSWKISDPVMENNVNCEEKDLLKARFAKGIFAPKGFMYYPNNIPKNINFEKAIKKAIKKTINHMTVFIPYVGYKGVNTLDKKILSLEKNDPRFIRNYLTHIVRMQEEIGTGGGGFRFLYAAFLKEATEYKLNNNILNEASTLMIDSGDTLRLFALECVKASKNLDKFQPEKISNLLNDASKIEKEIFKLLKEL